MLAHDGLSLGTFRELAYNQIMESALEIDVARLDDPHRRALEEVVGRQLRTNQRLLISFTDVELPPSDDPRPRQTLEQWTKIYDGLSAAEIDEIDAIIKTRANLTRFLPEQ